MDEYPAIYVNRADATGEFEIRPRLKPQLGPHEVCVRITAAALNYRDYALTLGLSFSKASQSYIPLSDGAGFVEAIGSDVTQWRPGDRVTTLFFPAWLSGALTPEIQYALGDSERGVAQRYFVAHETALIETPAHLSDFEAATLPCAGLTAWNAVLHSQCAPGDVVLLQGTGGVSLFALAFARIAGLEVIITSSSDEKLARAVELGANKTINYRSESDWGSAARSLTGGRGVDLVVEVGGAGTFMQSLHAIRLGGGISVVGMLSGGTDQIDVRNIYGRNANIRGATVGSKEMFAAMNRAITLHSVKPIIAEIYPWTEVEAAFRALGAGGQFGKIVLDFSAKS